MSPSPPSTVDTSRVQGVHTMPSLSTDGWFRYVDISAETGIAAAQLRTMLQRGNLPPADDRVGPSPVWKPETIRTWFKHRSAAYTYADLARETGFTINALRAMRKANRLPAPDTKTDNKENGWSPALIKPWLMNHHLGEEAYTFAEITEATGISYNDLRRMRKAGQMPEPDLRDGRSPAWSQPVIAGWIQGHTTAAASEAAPVVAATVASSPITAPKTEHIMREEARKGGYYRVFCTCGWSGPRERDESRLFESFARHRAEVGA